MKIQVDWGSFFTKRTSAFTLPGNRAVQHWLHSIEPFGRPINHPVECLFFANLGHISNLQNQPIWICRDGLIPLLSFFQSEKPPLGLKSKILIHEEFFNWVPEHWLKHVGTYRPYSNTKPKPGSGQIFFGLNSCLLSDPRLWKFDESSKKGTREQVVYFPNRIILHQHDSMKSIESNFSLFKRLAGEPRFADWPEIVMRSDIKTLRMEFLNHRFSIAYDWVFHTLASKGVAFSSAPLRKNEQELPMSPYHSLALNMNPRKSAKNRFNLPQNLLLLQHENLVSQYPWADHFGGETAE